MLVTSSGVKTAVVGAAEVTGAGGGGKPAVVTRPGSVGVPAVVVGAVDIGAVVIGAVVTVGSGGEGVEDDMIEPESLDTKLVETRVLPGLDRRL